MTDPNENMITAPFERQKLDEEKAKKKGTKVTVRLNEEEYARLKEVMVIIEQPKESTALKTMFELAHANVVQDRFTAILLATIFKNKRNNYRSGVLVDV